MDGLDETDGETPAQRAQRLGLGPHAAPAETPQARAERMGLTTMLREHGIVDPTFDPAALHREHTSGNLSRRIATENAQERDALPNLGTEILGPIAAAGRDIPGVEAAQAGASALVNRTSYRDALRNTREAGDASALGTPARLAGATLATTVLPGSAAQQGFVFGGLRGLLDADPAKGLEERGYRAAGEGILGSLLGKTLETGSTAVRGLATKPTDELAVNASDALSKKVRPRYAAADIEARGTQNIPQPIHPEVGRTLNDPDIKPWVDDVRNSPAFLNGEFGPPDAITALKQVYKNMGEAQRRGLIKVAGRDDFQPLTEQGVADLTVLKQKLAQAADHDMPSWNTANREFAQGKSLQDATEQGAKVGRRLVAGRETPLTQLESSSPASMFRDIRTMKPGAARATNEGILSTYMATPNPVKALMGAHRLSPMVRALDQKGGTIAPEILQALGITAADLPTHP